MHDIVFGWLKYNITIKSPTRHVGMQVLQDTVVLLLNLRYGEDIGIVDIGKGNVVHLDRLEIQNSEQDRRGQE